MHDAPCLIHESSDASYFFPILFPWSCLSHSYLAQWTRTRENRLDSNPTGVKAGGDRQELHEAIRVHSMDAGAVVKGEGKPNDLLERIAKDPLFAAIHSKLDTLVDPKLFVGRAPEQVTEFLAEEINPILEANKSLLAEQSVDSVNV